VRGNLAVGLPLAAGEVMRPPADTGSASTAYTQPPACGTSCNPANVGMVLQEVR
jgi:hypothetical protein